jgi:hypothetical protein
MTAIPIKLSEIDLTNSILIDSLSSFIGVERYFNIDNNYKDQPLLTKGIKTYGLVGSIFSISEYPLAFSNSNSVDNGDGTFTISNIFDGTIRHIKTGSARSLGTYEEDAMQNITGEFNVRSNLGDGGLYGSGAFTAGDTGSTGGLSSPVIEGVTITYTMDASKVVRTAVETRMKNTAGQWYLLVKIDGII